MKKLLFVGHDLKFANFLIDYYSKHNEYEVKVDKWGGHNIHDEQRSIECLEWADIIFCEWGLGNAVWYSNNKKENQKMIVRMHAQERKTEYPKQFNIKNIDYFIAVSPYIYEELYRIFKLPREKMKMIYNQVDVKKFNINKVKEANYNLGIVGILPKLKRIDRAIDILEGLNDIENKYRLFVKSKLPSEIDWILKNEEQNLYYEKVFSRINESRYKDKIIFDSYDDNMPDWFEKVGVILSTSEFESFHLAPMEGMASGAYPVIFNWEGSDTVYKDDWIVNEVGEAIAKIRNMENIKNNRDYIIEYVKTYYDKEKILKEYEEFI